IYLNSFFFHCHLPPRYLPSFPTRRSSDLQMPDLRAHLLPMDDAVDETLLQNELRALEARRQILADRLPDDARAIRQTIGEDLPRSEEHTSELQLRGHLVCRLLLEKKKK